MATMGDAFLRGDARWRGEREREREVVVSSSSPPRGFFPRLMRRIVENSPCPGFRFLEFIGFHLSNLYLCRDVANVVQDWLDFEYDSNCTCNINIGKGWF